MPYLTLNVPMSPVQLRRPVVVPVVVLVGDLTVGHPALVHGDAADAVGAEKSPPPLRLPGAFTA